jgi:hypothetical protein
MARVRSRLALIPVLAVLAGLAAAPAHVTARDFDCSDFKTHKKAQKFFKHHHPRQDPYGLDADNDGIACEDLP